MYFKYVDHIGHLCFIVAAMFCCSALNPAIWLAATLINACYCYVNLKSKKKSLGKLQINWFIKYQDYDANDLYVDNKNEGTFFIGTHSMSHPSASDNSFANH